MEPRTVVVVVFSSSWWAMTVRDDGVVVPSSTTPSPQNAFLQFVRQAPGRVSLFPGPHVPPSASQACFPAQVPHSLPLDEPAELQLAAPSSHSSCGRSTMPLPHTATRHASLQVAAPPRLAGGSHSSGGQMAPSPQPVTLVQLFWHVSQLFVLPSSHASVQVPRLAQFASVVQGWFARLPQ